MQGAFLHAWFRIGIPVAGGLAGKFWRFPGRWFRGRLEGPFQSRGQQRSPRRPTVASARQLEMIFITRPTQRRCHILIREGPVAVHVIQIRLSLLHPDPDWFRGLPAAPDHRGIGKSAPDIRVAPYVGYHISKKIRPLPRQGERRNGTTAHAAHRPARWICPQVHFFPDFWKDFSHQKFGKLRPHGIIFITPHTARRGSRQGRRNHPWIEKNAHGHRYRSRGYQVIQHHRRPRSTIFFPIPAPIQKYHRIRRLIGFVLGRNVKSPRMFHLRVNFAIIPFPLL